MQKIRFYHDFESIIVCPHITLPFSSIAADDDESETETFLRIRCEVCDKTFEYKVLIN